MRGVSFFIFLTFKIKVAMLSGCVTFNGAAFQFVFDQFQYRQKSKSKVLNS